MTALIVGMDGKPSFACWTLVQHLGLGRIGPAAAHRSGWHRIRPIIVGIVEPVADGVDPTGVKIARLAQVGRRDVGDTHSPPIVEWDLNVPTLCRKGRRFWTAEQIRII